MYHHSLKILFTYILFALACGNQPAAPRSSTPSPATELATLAQATHNPHSGSSSNSVGFTEVASNPFNGPCLGPNVGGYTCWIPFPSWYATDGAGWWNDWRYFDPEDFDAIAASFNSWLGFSAGTNGLSDAWTAATGHVGSKTMSFENDVSDDQFIVHAIQDQNLAGVAATNQTLNVHASLKLRVLEDGGTLTESPAHPATFKYARMMQWSVDTGTLGAWIGANCTTTACRRKAVMKIFGVMLMQPQGATLHSAIEPQYWIAPYISPGGPPTSVYLIDSWSDCLMSNFTYGTNLAVMTNADNCAQP